MCESEHSPGTVTGVKHCDVSNVSFVFSFGLELCESEHSPGTVTGVKHCDVSNVSFGFGRGPASIYRKFSDLMSFLAWVFVSRLRGIFPLVS